MAFFSNTLDKLKGALRKTMAVLNTDVRTLFILGRQIDDRFLAELEEKFIQADMGVGNVDTLVNAVRERWRLGRIRNAEEAKGVIKEHLLTQWPDADRELKLAPSGPTVVLVAGINGAGKTTSMPTGVAAEGTDGRRSWGVRQRHLRAARSTAHPSGQRIGWRSVKQRGRGPGRGGVRRLRGAKSRRIDVLSSTPPAA